MTSRLVVYCFMLLSLNIGLGFLQNFDMVYMGYEGVSLFGQTVPPYIDTTRIEDVDGTIIYFNSTSDLENSSQRIMAFTNPSGYDSSDNWWVLVKDTMLFFYNVFRFALFGLPAWLIDNFNLSWAVSIPLYSIIGIVWLVGLYSLKKGLDL